MAKEKFIYNTQTLRYEKVETSTRERIIKSIAFLCAVIVGGAVFTVVVWNFFPSPELTKEKKYNQIKTSSIEKISQDSSVQDFLKKFNSSIDEASIKPKGFNNEK